MLDLYFEKRHLKTKANSMKNNVAQHTKAFALTCPLLLTEEQYKEPYHVLEQIFNFSGLGGYREELTMWFKNALSEGVKCKRASSLLFIHDQFVRLIQAAFIIAQSGVRYRPIADPDGGLFCEWLVKSSYAKDKDCVEHHAYNLPYWLEVRYREAPLAYLQKTLTIKTVATIREGLHEWQEAASSKHMSIVHLEGNYLFEFYELLQKIIEACYLLLVADVKLNRK
jgi:hypothetical protein